jgi:hypothetical protein
MEGRCNVRPKETSSSYRWWAACIIDTNGERQRNRRGSGFEEGVVVKNASGGLGACWSPGGTLPGLRRGFTG